VRLVFDILIVSVFDRICCVGNFKQVAFGCFLETALGSVAG